MDHFLQAFIASMAIQHEKRIRLEQDDLRQAASACGFTIHVPNKQSMKDIRLESADGQPLNEEQQRKLAQEVLKIQARREEVKKEYQRQQAEQRQKEKERQKAEYDAVAATYREQRRKRFAHKMETGQIQARTVDAVPDR